MNPKIYVGSWQISPSYAISLVDPGVSVASPREADQSRICSLQLLAFGLTLSPGTKRLLLDGLCMLVTRSGVSDQSPLREGWLSSNMPGCQLHKTLCRSHQEKGALVAFFYMVLPLCHFYCHGIITSNLSCRFPLFHHLHQPPVHLSGLTSPWMKGLSAHKGTDNASFCPSEIWKLAPNLSFQWLPSCYHSFCSPLLPHPQQSLRLLTFLTLVMFIKILYLGKKSRYCLLPEDVLTW